MTSHASHKPAQRVGSTLQLKVPLAKVPVVKEELLSCLDGSLGKDTNPMVSVHHHNCNKRHNTRDTTSEMCSPSLGQSSHSIMSCLAQLGRGTSPFA